MVFSSNTEQAIATLAMVADIWQARLDHGWTPPTDSGFPWAQVRISLAALLPGMRTAREWVARGMTPSDRSPAAVTMILAGNTPLLSWSPLCAALLAGTEQIRVKMSRDETVWTPLFIESLRQADNALADRVMLYEFPGEDERTGALLQNTDAVIAYGSDASITALRARTPPATPFFGYGHAVSVGLFHLGDFDKNEAMDGFANDVLMYNQQGCLSPHILYGHGVSSAKMRVVIEQTVEALSVLTDRYALPAVTDSATASRIREARDMALFAGQDVHGDDRLRWTVIAAREPIAYPQPVGNGVLYLSPVESPEQFRELLRPVHGIVSCAGISGSPTSPWKTVLREAGVSRFCKPGEMQAPPLDWQNGSRDLLAELRQPRTDQDRK